MRLGQNTVPVLGSPLNRGPWAAIYEPSWERGHRRVFYTIDGVPRLPGRFAIDFIKMNRLGRFTCGNENVVKNWYGYGVNVLAVHDGMIVASRTDYPESKTLTDHPTCPADQAAGQVGWSVKIGNNQIAFYEHLKPRSLQVKAGQQVNQGQVLAQLGFTGQTTGPHLHFHVADVASPLGAEGLAFAFATFARVGGCPDFGQFGKQRWAPLPDTLLSQVRNERPAPNSVIMFEPAQ
jgi:murein DD-endopeptidase